MTSETARPSVPRSDLGFDDPDIGALLARMTPEELDALGFGVIGFDADDVVVVYNAYESRRAGISPERVLGRDVFVEVAPCANNYLVAQRFVDEADLDAQLDYVFTLRMRPTPVRLRLVASSATPLRYLLTRPA